MDIARGRAFTFSIIEYLWILAGLALVSDSYGTRIGDALHLLWIIPSTNRLVFPGAEFCFPAFSGAVDRRELSISLVRCRRLAAASAFISEIFLSCRARETCGHALLRIHQ